MQNDAEWNEEGNEEGNEVAYDTLRLSEISDLDS
jgi:hypothetical protein